MQEVTAFAGQNWLITPAARAVDEPPPESADQQLLLVLSGVAVPNLKAGPPTPAGWFHETLFIFPDVRAPLDYAIRRFGIPRPSGRDYYLAFALEQWAPFAGLSSIFDRQTGSWTGFAVDTWRLNPFNSGTDVAGQPVDNVFTGIQVDVALHDDDDILHRVSYNITLLGSVRFMRREL